LFSLAARGACLDSEQKVSEDRCCSYNANMAMGRQDQPGQQDSSGWRTRNCRRPLRILAHANDTGGIRRVHLRKQKNVLKCALIHLGGLSRSLVLRQFAGKGTPCGLQGLTGDAPLTFLAALDRGSAAHRAGRGRTFAAGATRPRRRRHFRLARVRVSELLAPRAARVFGTSGWGGTRWDDPFALLNRINSISRKIAKMLCEPAGPGYVHAIDLGVPA